MPVGNSPIGCSWRSLTRAEANRVATWSTKLADQVDDGTNEQATTAVCALRLCLGVVRILCRKPYLSVCYLVSLAVFEQQIPADEVRQA